MNIEAFWKEGLNKRKYDQFTSDFTIVAGERRFPVHKLVLSIHSEVFGTMFQNDMNENLTKETEITDYEPEVVEAFVNCIYNHESITDNFNEHRIVLLRILHKYSIVAVIAEIEKIVCGDGFLTTENVVDFCAVADLIDNQAIKNGTFQFMADNMKELFSTKAFAETLGSDLCASFLQFIAEMKYVITQEVDKVIVEGCVSGHADSINGEYFLKKHPSYALYFEKPNPPTFPIGKGRELRSIKAVYLDFSPGYTDATGTHESKTSWWISYLEEVDVGPLDEYTMSGPNIGIEQYAIYCRKVLNSADLCAPPSDGWVHCMMPDGSLIKVTFVPVPTKEKVTGPTDGYYN